MTSQKWEEQDNLVSVKYTWSIQDSFDCLFTLKEKKKKSKY